MGWVEERVQEVVLSEGWQEWDTSKAFVTHPQREHSRMCQIVFKDSLRNLWLLEQWDFLLPS